MKILVTGGAGFIGSHVVECFQNRAEILVLDNLRSGHLRNLEGLKCEVIDASITEEKAVHEAVKGVDYVFHLAALVSVPESLKRPSECEEINVRGLVNVLTASAEAGVKKLVFASSAAIYGNNPIVPKIETMPPQPMSPYSVTKLEGERQCGLFAGAGRLQTACLRFFNVFGPRQDPCSAYAAAVPIFIRNALASEPLTVFGDGEQTRDFIYVRDIVSALEFCAVNSVTGVFNCGYGTVTSLNELIRKILDATNSSSAVVYEESRPGDVKHSQADAGKLRGAGWLPQASLEAGLQATIEFSRTDHL